jgi:hypothetical protein
LSCARAKISTKDALNKSYKLKKPSSKRPE